MSAEVKPGFYQHFEGPLYRVRSIGRMVMSDSAVKTPGEQVVIYDALCASPGFMPNNTCVLPLRNFIESVVAQGKRLSRFMHMPEPALPDVGQTPLSVQTLYEDRERTIAFISVNGAGRHVINHGSDNTYEVLNGTGTITIAGVVHQLQKGTRITVPRDIPYYDEGRLVMVSTATPAFDPGAIELVQ